MMLMPTDSARVSLSGKIFLALPPQEECQILEEPLLPGQVHICGGV